MTSTDHPADAVVKAVGRVRPTVWSAVPPHRRGAVRSWAHLAARRGAQVLGGAGAVVAVGELLRHVPAGQALVWLVALATTGHAVVGVWMGMTGPGQPGRLVRAGTGGTALLLIGTLAFTDVLLFGQVLAALAPLTALSLRLGAEPSRPRARWLGR